MQINGNAREATRQSSAGVRVLVTKEARGEEVGLVMPKQRYLLRVFPNNS